MTFVKNKNKLFILIVGVFAFLLYFNYCVPITSDDMIFLYDELSIDSILYFGNGHFIGNTLADIIQIPILAIIERSLITLSIILLVCKLIDNITPITFCLSSICVLLPSSNIFSETYSWNAGYQNYVTPIIFVLTSAIILKKLYETNLSPSKKVLYYTLLFISGLIGQFFSENTSIFTVLFGSLIFIFNLIKNKKFDKPSFFYSLTTLIGFGIMMISPIILNVNDKMNGYREIQTSLSLLIRTAASNYYNFSLSFLGNYVLFGLTSVALLLMISNKKINFRNINIIKFQLIILPILSILLDSFIYQTTKPNVYIKILLIMAIPGLYIISFIIIAIKCGIKNLTEKEKFSASAYLMGIISFLPLLVVSPVGGRTFYLTYICITVGTICLITEQINNNKNNNFINKKVSQLCAFCILTSIIISFSFAFTDIKYSYDLREEFIQNKIQNSVNEISIPLLPNQRYVHTDNSKTHWDFYFNKNADYEVQYSFTDWESWIINNDIPH